MSSSPTTTVTASPKLTDRDPGRVDQLILPPSTLFRPDPAAALMAVPVHDCGYIHPYTSLRDGAIDLVGLGSAAYAVRRRSWGKGWRPPASAANDESATFMASQLVVLTNTGVFDKSADGATEISFEGQAGTLPPGSSSFSFFTEVFAKDLTVAPPTPDNYWRIRTHVGVNLLTLVNIDPATRRPKKLEDGHLAKLKSSADAAGAMNRVSSLGLTLLGRLPPHEAVTASGSGAAAAAAAAGAAKAQPEPFLYSMPIRCLSDMDFNRHVNQGTYARAAINAVVAMTANRQLGALAAAGADKKTLNTAWLNSIMRAIRIDYQSEIQAYDGELVAEIRSGSPAVTEMAAASVGPALLAKIAPPASQSTTTQEAAYFALKLKNDETPGKIYCRGFIVFDYTPVVVLPSAAAKPSF
jgi:hypothetical protein